MTRTAFWRLLTLLAATATFVSFGFSSTAPVSTRNHPSTDQRIHAVVLERSAISFTPSAQQAAGARALVKRFAAHEMSLKAPGAYQASPVISADGGVWLVLEGADAAIGANPSATVSPYPDGTVEIFRWSTGGWTEQGVVRAYLGPIGGCCGISAVSLTGSRDTDFALAGGGAADTNWLSVVSDIGGRWHAVQFDYGYSDTTVVNGVPARGAVSTEVDASSAAGGPTTLLYETYRDGVFRPAAPPGRSPPCDVSDLQSAAGDAQLQVFEFTKFACADGWAMAIGSGAGYSGPVVGLFAADGTNWRSVEVDNGASLGSDPGIYDIPLSLLRQLTGAFGASVKPALATAQLIAAPAMTGYLYVNGVIRADGADWYVKETAAGSAASPGAEAEIYRWVGSTWVLQSRVDNLPNSLNYFRAISGGWFEAVNFPGTNVPGFKMQGPNSLSSAVLTDAGGTWHVAG
jgi:hypothetical protein